MSLNREELASITKSTLEHYQEGAQDFWEGTCDHDVSQNYQAFLSALIQENPNKPLRILDFGCGPGRDLRYFKDLGHEAIGLEGALAFCKMAKAYSGCEVWQQNFLNLELPPQYFEGIFANASLFHVPRQELPQVLYKLHQTLKEKGTLFSSNPRGKGEGWAGRRYGAYMEFAEYHDFLTKAGFQVLSHYYRPPGKPREEQPWLAVVAQKTS